jgi:hypothetical protein
MRAISVNFGIAGQLFPGPGALCSGWKKNSDYLERMKVRECSSCGKFVKASIYMKIDFAWRVIQVE